MFFTDEDKYRALEHRDPKAEGYFFYGVSTTKIFCRPTCSARLPLKKNVLFFLTEIEAQQNKYRPCKRCKPDQKDGWNQSREMIFRACLVIRHDAQRRMRLDVDALVKNLGVSKWHFYRTFKIYTSMTPRKFYMICLEGKEPLVHDLPLIETKKNLKRKRQMEKVVQLPTPSDTETFFFDLLEYQGSFDTSFLMDSFTEQLDKAFIDS